MIHSIIFDFGDVFINLNKQATQDQLANLGLQKWNSDLDALNISFEKGEINTTDFLEGLQKQLPNASLPDIETAWNAVLEDFPEERLLFLETLSKKFRLFLLSNTDAIHIQKFEEKVGNVFSTRFYNCFEKVYFSFNLGMRKPDTAIYTFVLNENKLTAQTTLFVDDKIENIGGAAKTGLKTWHLKVGQDDVVQLFEKNTLAFKKP